MTATSAQNCAQHVDERLRGADRADPTQERDIEIGGADWTTLLTQLPR